MAKKSKYRVGGDVSSCWQLQEAKACFSEVVRQARVSPQRVTVHGREAVVVISVEEFERMSDSGRCGLDELMAGSPLAGVEFGESGEPMPVREVDL